LLDIISYRPTALPGKVKQSAPSVRPSVSPFVLTFESADLWTWVFVRMGHDSSSPRIQSQGHRSRVRVTVDWQPYEYDFTVTSAATRQCGEPCDVAETCGSGGVQRVWAC